MKTFSLLGSAAALVLAGPAMAATLITNGGFETGDYSSWTFSNTGGGSVPVVIAYGQASAYPTGAHGETVPSGPNGGTHGLYFSSDTASPHSLTQNVNVVSGESYFLSFDFYVPQNGYDNPYDASLGFSIAGTQAGDLLLTGSNDGIAPKSWQTFTTTWTATSTGSTALSFNFSGFGNTAADFVVDNVAMTAVPEPATWALMIGGFGLAGMQLRRRKTAVSFA